MKKLNSKNRIKYFLYTLLVAVLCSCGNEQAILNDKENPFIVESISAFSKTHSSYYNGLNEKSATRNNFFGSWYGRVVLPKGMFNVGDTIVVGRNCN